MKYLWLKINGDDSEKQKVIDWLLEGEQQGVIPDDIGTRSFSSIDEILKYITRKVPTEEQGTLAEPRDFNMVCPIMHNHVSSCWK